MNNSTLRGVAPDYILKNNISLADVLDRWSIILSYRLSETDIRAMLLEANITPTQWRSPDNLDEQAMNSLLRHYNTGIQPFNYQSLSNYSVSKEELIQAEYFLELRGESKELVTKSKKITKNEKRLEMLLKWLADQPNTFDPQQHNMTQYQVWKACGLDEMSDGTIKDFFQKEAGGLMIFKSGNRRLKKV